MNTIKLMNSFHNTEVSVRVAEDNSSEAWFEIQSAAYNEANYGPARRRLARVRNNLCGSSECQCGTVRG